MNVDYQARKQARRDYYVQCVHGQKLKPCCACSGSGYYDHNGSPACGSCAGTGKEHVPTFEEYLWEKARSAAHQIVGSSKEQ